MLEMTKTEMVKQHTLNAEWGKAFAIAGKFRRLGQHKDAITRAISARQNPSFYTQLGRNLEEIEENGRAALFMLFVTNEGNPNK